jgi:hypothetical protein
LLVSGTSFAVDTYLRRFLDAPFFDLELYWDVSARLAFFGF